MMFDGIVESLKLLWAVIVVLVGVIYSTRQKKCLSRIDSKGSKVVLFISYWITYIGTVAVLIMTSIIIEIIVRMIDKML